MYFELTNLIIETAQFLITIWRSLHKFIRIENSLIIQMYPKNELFIMNLLLDIYIIDFVLYISTAK